MRNDEKIDINLSEDIFEDELSQEEAYQLNYETAMRYINIAEHMKQFEDQEKYYHRAIQYLKKINDHKEFTTQIRELRKKKFAARAEGKIQLYEEACQIRDKATTPQDYISAQLLFHRIALYEEKNPISEKWTRPDTYARALECSDSAEQERYCEKMAELTEAKQKRQSLIASISLIVAIFAFVLFSRTTMFRRLVAIGCEKTGNYEYAYQKYDAVYQRTKEDSALQKYIEVRYKAAQKALKSGDIETARQDFKACAVYDYKDSSAQFTKIEIDLLKDGDYEEVVHFARMDWRILEKEDDRLLLIKDNALGSTPFNETAGATTWADSSVRAWLNGSYLEENFFPEEIDAIIDTEVVTEENPYFPGVDPGETTTDKLFLLSVQEEEQYFDRLHETKTCWWLRTPGAHEGSAAFVYKDKQVMPYGYDVSTTELTIKPAIWVSLK